MMSLVAVKMSSSQILYLSVSSYPKQRLIFWLAVDRSLQVRPVVATFMLYKTEYYTTWDQQFQF